MNAQTAPGASLQDDAQRRAKQRNALLREGEPRPFRLENEDDDGYDPWSDRKREDPLFEPDPWD